MIKIMLILFLHLIQNCISESVNFNCQIPYCSECDHSENDNEKDDKSCSKCITGYILKNNECIYFKEIYKNCISINEEDECTACHHGYFLNSSNICNKIPKYCVVHRNGICVQCEDGYSFNSKNECEKCANGCKECDLSNDYETCLTCYSSYYLLNGKCSKTLIHCTEYVADKPLCQKCDPGYYLNGTNCAEIPVKNCLEYKNETNMCEKCYGSLLYDKNNAKCVEGKGIDHCKEYLNLTSCSVCEDGYYLDNKHHCSQCSKNCIKCTTNDKCSECKDGYYVGANKICQECTAEEKHSCYKETSLQACNTCNSKCMYNDGLGICEESHCEVYEKTTDYCVQCENGYVLNSDWKSCFKPSSLCKTEYLNEINNQTYCLECYDGYYLTKDYQCKKCSEQCKTCIYDANECLICKSIEMKIEYQCLPCENKNCEKCDYSRSKCDECENNYILSKGECILSSCLEKNDAGDCILCQPQSEGKCFDLPNDDYSCMIVIEEHSVVDNSAFRNILILLFCIIVLLL